MHDVETRQMAAEATQVPAAETGHMSADAAGQMFRIRARQSNVAIIDICLVSTTNMCPVLPVLARTGKLINFCYLTVQCKIAGREKLFLGNL